MSDRKAVLNIGWGGSWYGDIEDVLKIDELLSKLTAVNTGYLESTGWCGYITERHRCTVDVVSRDHVIFPSEEEYRTHRAIEEGEKE